MSASAVLILDSKGKLLIARNYRGDLPLSVANRFVSSTLSDEQAVPPVSTKDGVNYVYIKHNSLFFLAISERNINAMMVLAFLHRVVKCLTDFFGEVCEESIRDNFVVIYELLDEMMDFGYPQTTDVKVLQELVTQESHKISLDKAPQLLKTITGAVSWRGEGIKYKNNEVFLDVIEKVNLLVAATGNVLHSEIIGSVQMKCLLSGMPELRLALNDRVQFQTSENQYAQTMDPEKKIEIEDVNFHQCVRLNRFDQKHMISFIPPDGEFELMSYRLTTQVRPLFWIEAIVDRHEHSRVEYLIKAKSQFKSGSVANNVEITIPVPCDAHSPKYKSSTGSCIYVPEKDAIVWSIKQFPGSTEFLLRAHLSLPSITDEELVGLRKPISVQFEIPYFTVSGLQVLYLKVLEKSGYQALPWVRYITRSGDYQIRT
eukprot:TRINITY_DN20743_c0_g1_i1.p1 TRINITY_DN20743_c0_g1~~TRINITY_DN20743_c0_g1_i1.p1  ORF type:complete len:438 (+),score=128.21 TRINITY_DN20743_c0_g1_i1:29-1315(+)